MRSRFTAGPYSTHLQPRFTIPPGCRVVVDDPKHGDEREAPVRVIMSQAQVARLIRMLRGVLEGGVGA